MNTFTIEVTVNADSQEAWALLDEWIGKTAPIEVVGFQVTEVKT